MKFLNSKLLSRRTKSGLYVSYNGIPTIKRRQLSAEAIEHATIKRKQLSAKSGWPQKKTWFGFAHPILNRILSSAIIMYR